MGRIKSALIKRTGQKLMNLLSFANNFEDNKKYIDKVMPSKKVKNKIAGYITKKTKIAQKSQSKVAE